MLWPATSRLALDRAVAAVLGGSTPIPTITESLYNDFIHIADVSQGGKKAMLSFYRTSLLLSTAEPPAPAPPAQDSASGRPSTDSGESVGLVMYRTHVSVAGG